MRENQYLTFRLLIPVISATRSDLFRPLVSNDSGRSVAAERRWSWDISDLDCDQRLRPGSHCQEVAPIERKPLYPVTAFESVTF